MNKPKVSVLIPMFNSPQGIKITLESLKYQNFDDFEIVVVDDGSTIESQEMAIKTHKSIILLKQENEGIAKALNFGLEHCSGKYIARIDCNDICLPNRIINQYNFLENNLEYGVVGGQIILIENDGSELGMCKYPISHTEIMKELLSKNPSILHTSAMIRKETLDKVGWYDPFYKLGEDFDLWCRISIIAKLANINEPVVKSLSTTKGITFTRMMENETYLDLALKERKERLYRGISWKNQDLRSNMISNNSIIEFNEKEIKSIFFQRRASFLFRSGEIKSSRIEYKKSLLENPKNLKSLLGISISYLPFKIGDKFHNVYKEIRDAWK